MFEITDIRVLDKNFELIGVIDTFQSFIWTERYNECGDFELYIPSWDQNVLSIISKEDYIEINDSDYIMVVETIQMEWDYELGNHILIKGRSLESILGRRIVWSHSVYENIGLGSLIKTLINDNIINPSDPNRQIPNFVFHEPIPQSIEDIQINSIQLYGEYLDSVIESLCKTYKVGFKLCLEDGNLVFYLYQGEDRSYNQEDNSYVIFSPEYDNILNSNYITSDSTYRNVCLVLGEGEGADRTAIEVKATETPTGLDRREMCIDESIDSSYDDDTELSYEQQLFVRGSEALNENDYFESFDGQINPDQLYIYRTDYELGDIVQVTNAFGMNSNARIIEYIRSYSDSGISAYPTFSCDDEAVDNDYSTIHTSSGGGGGGGGGGTYDHTVLINRDVERQHPIGAITQLNYELSVRPDTAISQETIINLE